MVFDASCRCLLRTLPPPYTSTHTSGSPRLVLLGCASGGHILLMLLYFFCCFNFSFRCRCRCCRWTS